MNTSDLPLRIDHLLPPPPDAKVGVLLQVGSFSPITIAHLRLLGTHKTLPAPRRILL